MKFKELKEKYGIVMLDRFFTDPVEMQYRETYLLKLLLNLYHNEVDAGELPNGKHSLRFLI